MSEDATTQPQQESVEILIKCALNSFTDIKVACTKDWTIMDLKYHLEASCVGNPDAQKQRIIYAGQCLKNELKLIDVLRPTSDVFHLVYPPTKKLVKRSVRGDKQEKSAAAVNNTLPAATITTSSEPVLDQTTPQQPIQFASYYPGYYDQTNMNNYWAYYQYMYNMGYNYNSYHHHPQGQMSQWYAAQNQPAVVAPPNIVQPPVLDQVGGNVPNAPQAPAAPVMNAQGGAAMMEEDDDDGEMRQRDWLDWIYMGCRASILLMILYFYSSVERFVFVMLACFFLYAIQADWFGLLRGRQQNRAEERQQEQPRPPSPAAEPNEAEDRADATSTQSSSAVPQTDVNPSVTTPEPSAWSVFCNTCYTFITTFFTSLIPERPPPVDMN